MWAVMTREGALYLEHSRAFMCHKEVSERIKPLFAKDGPRNRFLVQCSAQVSSMMQITENAQLRLLLQETPCKASICDISCIGMREPAFARARQTRPKQIPQQIKQRVSTWTAEAVSLGCCRIVPLGCCTMRGLVMRL